MAAPLNAAIGLGASAALSLSQGATRMARHFRNRSTHGARAVGGAAGAIAPAPGGSGMTTAVVGARPAANAGLEAAQPGWARRFRRTQAMRESALIAAHTLGAGDAGGASEGPDLKQKE